MAKKEEVSHQFPQMYGPRGGSAIGLLSELARFTCPKKQTKVIRTKWVESDNTLLLEDEEFKIKEKEEK